MQIRDFSKVIYSILGQIRDFVPYFRVHYLEFPQYWIPNGFCGLTFKANQNRNLVARFNLTNTKINKLIKNWSFGIKELFPLNSIKKMKIFAVFVVCLATAKIEKALYKRAESGHMLDALKKLNLMLDNPLDYYIAYWYLLKVIKIFVDFSLQMSDRLRGWWPGRWILTVMKYSTEISVVENLKGSQNQPF